MNYIDKYFVINLNGDDIKWNNCLLEFKKNNIKNFERIIYKIPAYSAINNKFYKNFSHNFLIKKKLIKDIKEYITFEYAIKMAHLKIINNSIQKKYNQIVILEDNFKFKKNFKNNLNNILDDANRCYYGLLYLSNVNNNNNVKYTDNLSLISDIHETISYCVNSRLFNILKM